MKALIIGLLFTVGCASTPRVESMDRMPNFDSRDQCEARISRDRHLQAVQLD